MKYKNIFRVDTTRLKNYDYGSNGVYYVTICTKNKIHYFGEIIKIDNENQCRDAQLCVSKQDGQDLISRDAQLCVSTEVKLTEIGEIALKYWIEIPNHFPFINLDEFVIMPDHIHGLLIINKDDHIDLKENQFGKQSKNLASVIRAYKASVKRVANQMQIDFQWQPRYYDRIIRNESELEVKREYIKKNPLKLYLEYEYSIL